MVFHNVDFKYRRKRSKRPQNQSDNNDDSSHYQELSVSTGDKTYQTLTLK